MILAFRQGFSFVTTEHLFVLDLIDAKLPIIDFIPSGKETKPYK